MTLEVLLINSMLTKESMTDVHEGWQSFTGHIIGTLSKQKRNIVFICSGILAFNTIAINLREKVNLYDRPHTFL